MAVIRSPKSETEYYNGYKTQRHCHYLLYLPYTVYGYALHRSLSCGRSFTRHVRCQSLFISYFLQYFGVVFHLQLYLLPTALVPFTNGWPCPLLLRLSCTFWHGFFTFFITLITPSSYFGQDVVRRSCTITTTSVAIAG